MQILWMEPLLEKPSNKILDTFQFNYVTFLKAITHSILHSTNVLTVTMTIKAFHSFFDVWSWRCTTQGTNIYNIYNIYWPLHDICRARRQWTMQMTSNLRRTPSARAHPPGPARAPCVAQTGKIHIQYIITYDICLIIPLQYVYTTGLGSPARAVWATPWPRRATQPTGGRGWPPLAGARGAGRRGQGEAWKQLIIRASKEPCQCLKFYNHREGPN